MLPVDLTLHPDMRARLKLEIAPLAGCIELILQRPDDLARCRVVALDQVRIVAVHDPHEVRQAFRRTGMQARSERAGGGGERGDQIDDLGGRLVQEARLDP